MPAPDVAPRWRWRAHLAVLVGGAVVAGGVTAVGLWWFGGGVGEEALALPAGAVATSCRDPAGDVAEVGTGAAPGQVVAGTDLREVRVGVDGERLSLRFAAEDDVPVAGAALAGDGQPVQWVVWLMDGDAIVYHLRAVLRPGGWELLRDDLREVSVVTAEAPAIDGSVLGWDVALADLPLLPQSFGWVALTTHGDPPVQDLCPDGDGSLGPASQVPVLRGD